MNINQLPDLILRSIFAKLPLRDLLRINLVCSHWSNLQFAVTCSTKKVIIVIGDEDALNLLSKELRFDIPHLDDLEGKSKPKLTTDSWAVLDLDWLDKSTTQFLVDLLPNITDAQIAVRGIMPTISIGEKSWGIKSIALEQIIKLLNRWTVSLETLRICLNFTDYYQQETLERDMPKLLECLNSLQTIKHLALNFHNCFFYESPKSPLDMPFLSKLETFYLDFQDGNELVYDSLIKYALPNQNLREIGISNIYDSDISHNFFSNTNNSEFYQRFLHFPSLEFSEPTELMRVFCERFCNLRIISLTIRNLPMIYKMARNIRALRSLVYLEINISFDEEHGIVFDPDAQMEMMRPVPVLPTVKILNIYAPLQKHTDLYDIQWHVMLPNLDVLHYNDGYSDCQICMPRQDSDSEEDEEEDNVPNAEALNENGNAVEVANNEVPNPAEEDVPDPVNLANVEPNPNVNLEDNNQASPQINDAPNENNNLNHPLEIEVQEVDEPGAQEDDGLEEGLNLNLLFGNENEDNEEEEPEDRDEVIRRKCLRLSLQPWRFCDKLRKVYTGDNDDPKVWKFEELWKTTD